MAATPSTMIELGSPMPSFRLPDPSGRPYDDTAVMGPNGLLVMFVCNHCPFVVHVAEELARIGETARAEGIGAVGICSNDAQAYPDDAPPQMEAFAERYGWSFPYLVDASQEVARAFQAACTPDFFLYHRSGTLFYRGRLDASRPGTDTPVNGDELRSAMRALAASHEPPAEQLPSIGCNIKWRTG